MVSVMRFEGMPAPMLLSREGLIEIRSKALRRHVWFAALSRMDRIVVELTINCVDKVKSTRLALALGRIACKLSNAFKSSFVQRVETIGLNEAVKIGNIATGWGSLNASEWKHDRAFIRFLGVAALNVPNCGRT
jgi:hypothetical protein